MNNEDKNNNRQRYSNNSMLPRYKIISYFMLIVGLFIIYRTVKIQVFEYDFWMQVSDRLQKNNQEIMPQRGNILSCDGQFLASSLPEYQLHFDFLSGGEIKDSTLMADMDSICRGLHEIFPSKSAAEFKKMLVKGRNAKKQNLLLWPRRVDFNTYMAVKKLPVFNMGRYKGGFYGEKFISRRKPFGSLANRTIGDLYGAKYLPKCGLELSYDSILRGKSGIKERRKVLNKYTDIVLTPPENGCDIMTTIDVDIQDLAEKAVIDELKEINGYTGVAIVMEVKTGDIKAIVNIGKSSNGIYYEDKNHAVSDLLEPGSVFKTASMLVALDDGVADTTDMVDTGCGIWEMYGSKMRDHNWHRGGYGMISFPQTLMYSSNVGVSRIIDEKYKDKPEKFVEGLRRIGIAEDLKLDIPGYSKPRIRMPHKNKKGHYDNWYKTTLPWMSIGYETQVPPISVVSFYNAIANDGKMMKPRLVKKVLSGGETVREYAPVVLKEQICGQKALKEMQAILRRVVRDGTGKKAGSKSFSVSGKTGTAQISKNGGYKVGTVHYLLSFVGYFPSESPRYTCIVCLQKKGLPASGGSMSGKVFHNIAEGIMAKDLKIRAHEAKNENSVFVPDVKNGNISAASNVLGNLDVKSEVNNVSKKGKRWGTVENTESLVKMSENKYDADEVPNVKGMGARDATYLLQRKGIKVFVNGKGKVKEQSLVPGKKIIKGEICRLTLA